ncbi:terpenoid synthase [Penicillium lagena]|uniref:terpenoid synthase n=1 Tax=Penicillium lagena TaxID=94218 RepID=UPI0025414B89|nr:terpenoid synthase [Penicillium lagena]KAJ5612617.1 terpenoid synthase [Penicillium lagena]
MASISRQNVLQKLQNQTLHIKGLHSSFRNWPFQVNSYVDQVRYDVNYMVTRYGTLGFGRFPHHPKLHKLLQGDYGLFGATWWPNASYEGLLIATYLSLWLFMWDDELDSDVGSLAGDFELGQEYRAETLDFVRSRLGLDESKTLWQSSNEVINSFDVIGDALRESCSRDQRERFLHEFRFFMDKSETEQALRLKEDLVTVDEFSRYRLGTSAVRVVLAINEFCNGTHLPPEVTDDPEFDKLWDLTNVNICNVNDLLSVKKEIAQGSAESLVPILFAELGSAQKAVDQVMHTIRLTIKEFDISAKRLRMRHSNNREVAQMLDSFILGCKYYCTGNLSWSMSTGRYGVYQDLESEDIVITLGDVPARK